MDSSGLENRLIDFASSIIELIKLLPNNKAGNHMAGQITRSGISPALNYGEAQCAESRKDFIHKMSICLKELKETLICLKIIDRSKLCKSSSLLDKCKEENNELISIFVSSINTAKKGKL